MKNQEKRDIFEENCRNKAPLATYGAVKIT